jgi:APA family basic amino acid/polyamine antiporter
MRSPEPAGSQPTLVRGLGLVAATAIVVAEVIGTGVFLKARVMTCNVEYPWAVVAVWILAGMLAMAGALTYGELSAMLPRAGGEYVFIREAYGRLAGFLFGWMRTFIGNTGGLAALSFGLGIFLNVLSGGALATPLLQAPLGGTILEVSGIQAAAIAALSIACALNCMSISSSGRLASLLAVLKVAFILGIAALASSFGGGDWSHLTMAASGGACEGVPAAARGGVAGAGAAMIAAMWAYNGWNEVTYISGEVRDPGRTLPRALAAGLCVIAFLYVSVNLSYFHVLTPVEVAGVSLGSTVATDVVTRVLDPQVGSLLAAAFAMSVFSALVMATLVAARVPYAMAEDGLFFKALAKVSPRSRVPIRALVSQTVWAALLVLSGSFDTLTDYAMFSILLFVAMATASVFVFRRRWPDVERPYRTLGYPVVPVVAIAVTSWLLVNTLMTAPSQAVAGLALLAAGVPFYWYWSRTTSHEQT